MQFAKEVGSYFRLNENEMNEIIVKTISAVKGWESIAKEIGIPRSEQEHMKSAFLPFL